VLRVAIENGLDPITAIQAVTINAAEYYNLQADLGAVSPGKVADIVFLEDLATVDVARVMVDGEVVAEDGEWVDREAAGLPTADDHPAHVHEVYPESALDTVSIDAPTASDFGVEAPEGASAVDAEVMRVHENQVVTSRESARLPVSDGTVDLAGDVSKAAVFERHGGDGSVGLGFVTGFGFERGAVASTVAHDSHNLLVVGSDDAAMAAAASEVVDRDGGMVAVDDDGAVLAAVPLPVAGLMSDRPLAEVAERVHGLETAFRDLGCDLNAPFMTMSLLALAVLPSLRLTNRGLVDTDRFDFVDTVAPADD
jgi:adenine deaminase